MPSVPLLLVLLSAHRRQVAQIEPQIREALVTEVRPGTDGNQLLIRGVDVWLDEDLCQEMVAKIASLCAPVSKPPSAEVERFMAGGSYSERPESDEEEFIDELARNDVHDMGQVAEALVRVREHLHKVKQLALPVVFGPAGRRSLERACSRIEEILLDEWPDPDESVTGKKGRPRRSAWVAAVAGVINGHVRRQREREGDEATDVATPRLAVAVLAVLEALEVASDYENSPEPIARILRKQRGRKK